MSDFFDDDLEKLRRREPAGTIPMGPSSRTIEKTGGFESTVGGGSDLNLTRMGRHKEQVEDQVATAMKELEQLRQRQEDLESQKADLQDLRKKQQAFQQGRRELMDRMNQSLVTLEKEELQAEQHVELLSSARKQFRNRMKELDSIHEQSWTEDRYRTELSAALTRIEEARTEYNKTMGRIQANRSDSSTLSASAPVDASSSSGEQAFGGTAFTATLMRGLALTLPVVVAIVLLTLVILLVGTGVI